VDASASKETVYGADRNYNTTAAHMSGERSTDTPSSVAAVVLNWNGGERLLKTLSALYTSEHPLSEIILVDNGSIDGSVEAVQKQFPLVKILPQKTNLGASEGRNVGIRHALASGVKYVFNIDNDIEVHPKTIGELIRIAEQRSDVGIVGTMMYFKHDPTLIQNVGAQIAFRQNVHLPIGWLQRDRGQFIEPIEVDMVGSGAMLTRSEVFQQAGYFDAGYLGCQLDDTDFCMKVRRAGWKILCNPRAKIAHDFYFNHRYSYRRKYLESHNAVLFLRKYGRSTDWAKYLFFALGGLPYAFGREMFQGNLGGVLGKAQGLFDALLKREQRAMQVFLSRD
jgi:GT2 family glycosyltransferase